MTIFPADKTKLNKRISGFSLFKLKPIFHCNAKYLALGAVPNANPRIWVGDTHWSKRQPLNLCSPNANPRRQSVEYRWRWVFWRWPCIFHIYFTYILRIFHVVCASFSMLATRKLADAKADSSGIWVQKIEAIHKKRSVLYSKCLELLNKVSQR